MKREIEPHICRDLDEKIVILSGPRQVGKTTLSRQLLPNHVYLNHDSTEDRRTIQKIEWPRDAAVIVLDELHKMRNWKSWIKGIYDTEGVRPRLLVTGSARLETYRKGGDSLSGRFFPWRLHPLTVREICTMSAEEAPVVLDRLLAFGGFPEPYLKQSELAAKRWRKNHVDTILREDLLDLENVRDIKSMEILLDLLRSRVGYPVSYASLAVDLQVSIPTVKHWLQILENLYVIFPVRPYHKNIARSLLKMPKYYLFDIGAVRGDRGARFENLVAASILRELHLLEDAGGARTSLHYLRDKQKREVDFLVLVDETPVLLVEVKAESQVFAPALFYYREFFREARAVQVVYGLRQRKESKGMVMVPASEFLATLRF
jgi:uncharacterized protein